MVHQMTNIPSWKCKEIKPNMESLVKFHKSLEIFALRFSLNCLLSILLLLQLRVFI